MLLQVDATQGSAPAILMLLAAAVMIYVASRSAGKAIQRLATPSPLWRAAGHWLPIGITCVWATLLGHDRLALGTLFASSVACLTLVLGLSSYAAPERQLPPGWRRIWLFVLPVSVLCLVAGFAGELRPIHALVLGVQGLLAWLVWSDPLPESGSIPSAAALPPPEHPRHMAVAEVALAAVLAVLGVWLLMRGAQHAAVHHPLLRLYPASLIGATLVAPLLVLPMIGSGMSLSYKRQFASAGTSCVIVVLLNLCVLLPTMILIAAYVPQPAEAVEAVGAAGRGLYLPVTVWRLDVIILIILGIWMIPLAIGRWTIERVESMVLIGGYVLYMAMVARLAMWG